MHDSIEDARTALQLYHKYLQLKAEGVLGQTLEMLYQDGGTMGWQIPDA